MNYALYRECILGSINTKFKAKLQRKGNDSVYALLQIWSSILFVYVYLYNCPYYSKVSWKEGGYMIWIIRKDRKDTKSTSLFTKTYHRLEDTVPLRHRLPAGSSPSSSRCLMIRRRRRYFVRLSRIVSRCRR